MKCGRHLFYAATVFLLGALIIGCRPKINTMAKAEEIFIKMVDKTAKKLDFDEDQKIQLERLKTDIRENFGEGQREKNETLTKIKQEGKREKPQIGEMTVFLQGMLRDETERINRAFDLMLGFKTNLNEDQKEKLTQMISEWVAKWD
jgi:hypothetical protein